MTAETWKNIPGYPGYQASTLGRIRSLDRWITGRYGQMHQQGRILRPAVNGGGYAHVHLGKGRDRYVHRLVLLTFEGECPAGQEARHGVNGKTDNSITNLCYGTRAENCADKQRDGTVGRSTAPHRVKLSPELVVAARVAHGAGRSVRSLAIAHGVSWDTMKAALTGVTWSRLTLAG